MTSHYDWSLLFLMEAFLAFLQNNFFLSGLFVAVLVAWLAWEVARLGRKWQELDTLAAVQFINRQDPLILDVSNSTDYAQGHIAGAMHMPPSRIEAGNQRLIKASDRPVLVYCKSGQVSPQMANRLVKMGFAEVKMLTGGLSQWVADKQPISREKPSSGKQKKEKNND